jgi:hypothetical protein
VDEPAAEFGGSLGVRKPVIGPGALGVACDEPGVREELEVPGDSGLALSENLGQVLDRMFAFAEEGKQPQPCGLAGRPERSHQCRGIRQIGLPFI